MFRNSTNKGVKPVFSNTKRTNAAAAAEAVIPSGETTEVALDAATAKPAEEEKEIVKDTSNERTQSKDNT